MSHTEFAVNFFVALFALIDPVGNVPLFAAGTYSRSGFQWTALYTGAVMAIGFAIAWCAPNSQSLLLRWQWSPGLALLVALLAFAALLNLDRVTEFLYFNF